MDKDEIQDLLNERVNENANNNAQNSKSKHYQSDTDSFSDSQEERENTDEEGTLKKKHGADVRSVEDIDFEEPLPNIQKHLPPFYKDKWEPTYVRYPLVALPVCTHRIHT
jgi:hypothetical protein